MIIVRGDRLQLIDDRQVLRTYALTLTAFYTVLSLAEFFGKNIIICEVDRPALFFQTLTHILVVEREILRDSDLLRTASRAVGAAGARYRNLLVDDPGSLEGIQIRQQGSSSAKTTPLGSFTSHTISLSSRFEGNPVWSLLVQCPWSPG